MAESVEQLHYKFSPAETRRLIRFRVDNDAEFLRSKYSAKKQYETFVSDNGLQGKVSGKQVSKKWENLKQKYRLLSIPKSSSGTDSEETTAPTWQFYELMHEALGSRSSIDPTVLGTSFHEEHLLTMGAGSGDDLQKQRQKEETHSPIPVVSTSFSVQEPCPSSHPEMGVSQKRKRQSTADSETRSADVLSSIRDEDELFLLSLLPSLKRLNVKKRMEVRMKFQQVLYAAEFED